MKKFRPSTVRRAYTLVEMIVVVAVLGISGSLLVPNLIDRSTFAIQAASRALISDLIFAQSDALANQEYRRIQFLESDEAGSGYIGYCITRVTPENFNFPYDANTADHILDPMANSDVDGRYIVDFSKDGRFGDVRISSVSIDSGLDFITFDEFGGSVSSSGGAPGTGGEIELESGEGSLYRVTISPFTGKTTVEVLQSGS